MGKKEESLSSFICYNCKEKNYFDKSEYLSKNESEKPLDTGRSTTKIKEVSIECKSCREMNNITVEY